MQGQASPAALFTEHWLGAEGGGCARQSSMATSRALLPPEPQEASPRPTWWRGAIQKTPPLQILQLSVETDLQAVPCYTSYKPSCRICTALHPPTPYFHGLWNLTFHMVISPVGRGQNMPLTGVRPIPDPEAKLGMDPPGLRDSKENQGIF